MRRFIVSALIALGACSQQPAQNASPEAAEGTASQPAEGPLGPAPGGEAKEAPSPAPYRFVGHWAADVRDCPALAWRFTDGSLAAPAGSQCTFSKVVEVPGGYDIDARCTAEGPPTDDVLKLRFAESAKALLFESSTIADAGLVSCD